MCQGKRMFPTLAKWITMARRRFLASRARDWLKKDLPDGARQAIEAAVDRTYQLPTLRRLTLEQARMFLIGHAMLGDQDASDLMEIVSASPIRPGGNGGVPRGQPSAVYARYQAQNGGSTIPEGVGPGGQRNPRPEASQTDGTSRLWRTL
jgi:hypothetical protein